jgi:hypothetical protein
MYICYSLSYNGVLNLGLPNLNHSTSLKLSLGDQRMYVCVPNTKRVQMHEMEGYI